MEEKVLKNREEERIVGGGDNLFYLFYRPWPFAICNGVDLSIWSTYAHSIVYVPVGILGNVKWPLSFYCSNVFLQLVYRNFYLLTFLITIQPIVEMIKRKNGMLFCNILTKSSNKKSNKLFKRVEIMFCFIVY